MLLDCFFTTCGEQEEQENPRNVEKTMSPCTSDICHFYYTRQSSRRNCTNQLKRCQISGVCPCPKSSLENLYLSPHGLEIPLRNDPVFDQQIVHGAEIESIVLAVGHLAYSAVSSTAIKFAPVLSTSCGHSNEQHILLHK